MNDPNRPPTSADPLDALADLPAHDLAPERARVLFQTVLSEYQRAGRDRRPARWDAAAGVWRRALEPAFLAGTAGAWLFWLAREVLLLKGWS